MIDQKTIIAPKATVGTSIRKIGLPVILARSSFVGLRRRFGGTRGQADDALTHRHGFVDVPGLQDAADDDQRPGDGADGHIGLDLGQGRLHRLAVEPGGALDQAGYLEADHHQQEADRDQPELDFGQAGVIDAPPHDDGDDVIDGPHGHEGEGAEQRQVRVTGDPVGEVDQAVEAQDRLERPLDAGDEVEDRADDHELQGQALVDLAPLTPHRQPDISQEGKDRDKEAQAAEHGEGLQPAGGRGAQDMVLADQAVEESQAPEADQGQQVAVEGRADNDRDNIVGDGHAAGGKPVAEHVVPVEPLPDHVVDPLQAAGREARPVSLPGPDLVEDRLPHHIADEVEGGHPDHSAHDIPEADEQLLFLAGQNGPEDIIAGAQHPDHDHDVERPDQLGIFAALGHAVQQGNDGADAENVPEDHHDIAQHLAVQLGAAQFGHNVKEGPDLGHAQPEEEHAIGVQLAHAAEFQPGDTGEGIRAEHLDGGDQADQVGDRQPENGRQKPVARGAVLGGKDPAGGGQNILEVSAHAGSLQGVRIMGISAE